MRTNFCSVSSQGIIGKIFCIIGKKKQNVEPKEDKKPENGWNSLDETANYELKYDLVAKINRHQVNWKAGIYEEYENFTLGDLIRRSGGKKKIRKPFTRYRNLAYLCKHGTIIVHIVVPRLKYVEIQ